MTAWAAKFFTNSICLSVKGRTSWRKTAKTPINSFSLIIGTFSSVRAPPNLEISDCGSRRPCHVLSATWAAWHGFQNAGERLCRRKKRLGFAEFHIFHRRIMQRATRRKPSPSRSSIEPNAASQIRTALSSMVWNTGTSSPGDELMTRKTSEVAVCCSRDSW